jgi:hypothetical protein
MTVLRPISSAVRYDPAIDFRKCGRILFRVCSADARRPSGVPYHGQADAFGVYCPQTTGVYLIPMAAVADLGIVASLRVDSAKNGQTKRVRYAIDYEIKRALWKRQSASRS